jgi:asparagine synthase (glutamine-hydrolysing)
MPGFLGYIGDNKDFSFCHEKRKHLLCDSFISENYNIERRTLNKFLNDKVCWNSDKFLIITEGVILNRKQLKEKYNCSDFKDCVIEMYQQTGETFFNEFRGSFSGLLFDKIKNTWIIYTNHIGDKQVFYTQTPEGLLFGSEMGFMVETLKLNNLTVTLNKTGAYLALTHGFVIEDHTLVTEVKKLTAGHYLRYDSKGLEEIQYHRFTNKPKEDMTIDEAIEGIDKYFRNAVKLQFDKDEEYRYKHITCLSGGLDSRMTVWIAHQMGYTEQLNTTFSQSNYLDFTIAQQIATDLKHDFLFKALDHGNFIKDIDKVTELTYGNANFFGLAHGKSMYDILNFESYGIAHTGMIGDSIIGTFFKKPEYNPEVKIGLGAYSLELIERLSDYTFKYEYENEEIFCLYTRAFTGANQGMLVFQEHTESVSPFCDVDFIEFCYSIPLLLRFNHKIYFDWILQKYPGAAEYMWEKKRAKIHPIKNKEPRYMYVFGYKLPAYNDEHFVVWLKGSVLRRLGLRKKREKAKTLSISTKDNMNPIDYWYNENFSLRQFLDTYYIENKHYILDEILFADMNHLFNDCVFYDKLQTLSVLSAIKLIEK